MELRNLIFYYSKPLIPRLIQIGIRRAIAVRRRKSSGNIWPIDKRAGRAPVGWKGWPKGKRFAFLLMHDVDTCEGQRKAPALLELDQQHGFRSSFNFVPERYPIAREIQDVIRGCGYEVGVHGLRHDGKLFLSRSIFQKQAKKINAYLKEWGSLGFVSPSMLRNLDYTAELDILYDISTFDTDPFEPQPYAVRTVFPFIVYKPPLKINVKSIYQRRP